MIPAFWLKSTPPSCSRVVQLHFFGFLFTIPLPDTFLSWAIWSYTDFVLSIPVLTWPQSLNRAPKPRPCFTLKLLCRAQDFPDSNVHMYISKKLLWMQTFLNPLMTAIESGTASADATLLTCISHYCNEQSTGSGNPAADRDLSSCNCYLLLIKRYCTDKFCPQTLCKHTKTLAGSQKAQTAPLLMAIRRTRQKAE